MKLASDENFDGDIVRGLLRALPELDIVRVQDADLAGSPDPVVLAWAAGAGRVLLTHDRDTMPNFATIASAPASRCRASSSSAIACPRAKPSSSLPSPYNASRRTTAETRCITSRSEIPGPLPRRPSQVVNTH
jgi:hypothetical protein